MQCGGQGGLRGGEQAEEGGAVGPGPGLRLRRKCPPAARPLARGVLGGDRAAERTERTEPRCPAGELSRGMQCGRRPRLCSRSSLLSRRLLPSPTPLLRPSLLVLSLSLSPPTVFPVVLLPFSPPPPALIPGRPCKVAPESPGSRTDRQPPAAAAGFLGCSLPGWNPRATFGLFWKQLLGF